MVKTKLTYILKIFIIFILMYLFCIASIQGGVAPFGIAFAFALLLSMDKPFIIAPIYMLSNLLTDISMQNLIISAVSAGIILIIAIFYQNRRFKI